MKLQFRLLVIDDHPDSIDNALGILSDHLQAKGFTLDTRYAEDLSEAGLRALARKAGREYDLVAIDYHLGTSNGAVAAAELRRQLQFTDMVFYSSDSSANLLEELAKADVAGVFVARRDDNLDEALKGLADTVIGKAVDLTHMRGIAMAEVAEMDVLMEEVLETVFSSQEKRFTDKGLDTISKLVQKAEEGLSTLKAMASDNKVLDIITNPALFTSAHKYQAINRVVRCLKEKPSKSIETLKTYEADIIQNRNTLAHAKEDVATDGVSTLRAIKRNLAPVTIDESWMVSFRGKLHSHRVALDEVCSALRKEAIALAPSNVEEE